MKIKKSVPDHEIIIPDRIETGGKYWNKQVVHGQVGPNIYDDIESDKRLSDEEVEYILEKNLSNTKGVEIDMKLFDKLKDYVVNKVIAIVKDPKVWKKLAVSLLEKIQKSLDTPEKRIEIAKWCDEKINLPFLDQEAEEEMFPEFIEYINDKLVSVIAWVESIEV